MSRYLMCDVCGRRLRRVYDFMGHWDGETYHCDYCSSGDDYDDDDELSIYDAADIWASSGKDEDDSFGFTDSELNDALK